MLGNEKGYKPIVNRGRANYWSCRETREVRLERIQPRVMTALSKWSIGRNEGLIAIFLRSPVEPPSVLLSFLLVSRVPIYHLWSSVRTGYGLVSRCTPAESGLSGASRHCHRRLRGALFFHPLSRAPPSARLRRSSFLFFLSLFTCLFFLRTSGTTRTYTWSNATCTLYHFVIRFLSRDHDETRLGGNPLCLRRGVRQGDLFGPCVTRSAVTHPSRIDGRTIDSS